MIKYIGLILLVFLLYSCNKDDQLNVDVNCHRTVMVGKWKVDSEFIQYFEVVDSTSIFTDNFDITLNEDGTGSFNSSGVNSFNWVLQCEPDRFLITKSGETSAQEDPMNFLSLIENYSVDKISTNEIRMSWETRQGDTDLTRRKETLIRIYSRSN